MKIRNGFPSNHSRNNPRQRRVAHAIVPVLLAFSGLCISPGVQAQTAQTEAALILRSMDEVNFTLGMGVAYAPKYQGSDEYQLAGTPLIAAQIGPFYLDPIRGLGAEFQSSFGLNVGAGFRLDTGRDDKDKLRGMGRVHHSTVFDISLSQPLASWLVVDAGASLRIAGQRDRGNQYRLGLTFIPYQSETDVLTIGLGADFGDEDYNQTYFGVSNEQSARTGYRSYQAESGLHEQSLSFGWSHALDKHWALDSFVAFSKIGSKVKDSPIVFDDTGYSVGASISYNF